MLAKIPQTFSFFLSFFSILFLGCEKPAYVNDGYCDDNNNNGDCNFDGGDCCGEAVKKDYCKECKCLGDAKPVVMEDKVDSESKKGKVDSHSKWGITFMGTSMIIDSKNTTISN